jgi:hypothetical protein
MAKCLQIGVLLIFNAILLSMINCQVLHIEIQGRGNNDMDNPFEAIKEMNERIMSSECIN